MPLLSGVANNIIFYRKRLPKKHYSNLTPKCIGIKKLPNLLVKLNFHSNYANTNKINTFFRSITHLNGFLTRHNRFLTYLNRFLTRRNGISTHRNEISTHRNGISTHRNEILTHRNGNLSCMNKFLTYLTAFKIVRN
jgi:hypothetical protein